MSTPLEARSEMMAALSAAGRDTTPVRQASPVAQLPEHRTTSPNDLALQFARNPGALLALQRAVRGRQRGTQNNGSGGQSA